MLDFLFLGVAQTIVAPSCDVVLWCRYCSVSFLSLVLCHLVIAPIRNTKKLQKRGLFIRLNVQNSNLFINEYIVSSSKPH